MAKKITEKKLNKKIWCGKVISEKGDKTIVVKISSIKTHAKYHKKFQISKKYHVHDPLNKYHVGDMVSFVHSKPYSKTKHWIAVH